MRSLLLLVLVSCASPSASRLPSMTRMRNYTASPVRIAYHEAGHAIVALHVGFSVHRVRAFVGSGFTEVEHDERENAAMVQVLMAGHLAEQRFGGYFSVPEAGALDDYRNIRRIAAKLNWTEEDLTRTYAETEALLCRPDVWVSVSSLAHRLIRQAHTQ